MKSSFRWYGETDPVTLAQIAQIPGMRSIVSAVYDVKPGEVWPEESIRRIADACKAHGLIFDVVESIPVTEEIKLGLPERERHIENYCESIRRCAKYGIKCVTYNFMPVFDWTRSQLDYKLPDGSNALAYVKEQVEKMDPLKGELSLPGWDSSYTKDGLRALMEEYSKITEEDLWDNLKYFLDRVIKTAEEVKVKMAIHPDDPPWSIFGLPRIITNKANIERFLKLYDSKYNGLTLCSGSLGVDPNNDIVDMVHSFADRIHFAHIRNVKITGERCFEEAAHRTDSGSLDIYGIVKAYYDEGFDGYIRPDHGRMIWGETGKPGYGLFDRALGAVYINGLWEAVSKSK